MSNLSAARIHIKSNHVGHMRARTSKSSRTLCFRSDRNINTFRPTAFKQELLQTYRARSYGEKILQTLAATPASGVHLMGRTWPLGVTKRSDCVVSPAPVITMVVYSPPRHGRGGAEGVTTSDRARFLIPLTASWFQLSSRVSTLLLMLREGGWEWAGPSDSFELANLITLP